MKLSKDEEKVLSQWRSKNDAAWERDITKAAELAADGDTRQGDVADYRAQVNEMRALKASGADYDKHYRRFGYPRHRCICDQQWTHPGCRVCS